MPGHVSRPAGLGARAKKMGNYCKIFRQVSRTTPPAVRHCAKELPHHYKNPFQNGESLTMKQ
jgi:hypothetical protein